MRRGPADRGQGSYTTRIKVQAFVVCLCCMTDSSHCIWSLAKSAHLCSSAHAAGVLGRYYSQNIAVNECVYRHRHLYDFIAVIDRDEFIKVQSAEEPKQANLTAILRAALDGTKHASASMFTGR